MTNKEVLEGKYDKVLFSIRTDDPLYVHLKESVIERRKQLLNKFATED